MIFSPKKWTNKYDFNIKIERLKIERITTSKLLWIIVDDRLTWQDHIVYTTTTFAKSI